MATWIITSEGVLLNIDRFDAIHIDTKMYYNRFTVIASKSDKTVEVLKPFHTREEAEDLMSSIAQDQSFRDLR
jgi:hypothetical protein